MLILSNDFVVLKTDSIFQLKINETTFYLHP